MEYTEDVQKLFLQFMITEPDLWVRSNSIITSSYFHHNLRPAIELMQTYTKEFNGLPKEEQLLALTGIKIDKIDGILDADRDWYMANIEQFCRQRALEAWLNKGVDYVADGKYGQLEQGLKDALLISLYKNLGTQYFEDPKARLLALKDNNGQIKTGWRDLDAKLYGGVNFGELHIFAGGSGSGKSLFLQNLSLNFAIQGFNVVYMSLELSEELVSMRLDCMITGMGSKEIFKNIDQVNDKVIATGKKSGQIIVKEVAQGSTVNDIKSYLKEIEIQEGIRPDILVVDYLDLLMPNDKRVDPSNLFIKDKFISEELRGLSREGLGPEHKLLCITASQLNRSSVEETDHNHAHIAGGKSKIDTADGVYSIHTSKSMKEHGIYELQLLKTRNSAGTGDKIRLGYNIASMRIGDYDGDEDDNSDVNSIMDKIKGTKSKNYDDALNNDFQIEETNGTTTTIAKPKPKIKATAGVKSRNILDLMKDLKDK